MSLSALTDFIEFINGVEESDKMQSFGKHYHFFVTRVRCGT